MVGPYITSRGTVGTKMSANADLITLEANVQQGKYFTMYGKGGVEMDVALRLSYHTPLFTFTVLKSIFKCHINIPETTQLINSPSLYIWMRHYNILTSKERFTLKSKTQRKKFM